MIVVYILIGIIAFAFISSKVFGGAIKKIENFGSPRIFLNNIISKLTADYPQHTVIVENQSRLKIKFQSKSFSLTTDFIYKNETIQVCLIFDTMTGVHKVKTFDCPYSPSVIEKEIENKYLEFLGM